MTLTGAVMAPRWTYIDPAIAFNPMISFQVVIMALLGGAGALFGPLLGVIPLVLLFEVLSANFPNYFSILLGVVFMVIVYACRTAWPGSCERWLALARARRQRCDAGTRCSRDPLLAVEGLRKTFGGLVAVDDLSFPVEPGEIVGLIGPNGSGKTTVLNLISGALRPDAGTIRFKGQTIASAGRTRSRGSASRAPSSSCASCRR